MTAADLAGTGRAAGTPELADGRRRDHLGEVCAVLWPSPATASLAAAAATGRGIGTSPGADQHDLLVLPSASRPRLVVPASGRAAAAALRRYGEPGSIAARAGRQALALALRGGAGAAGLGGRLRVRVPAGADTIETYLTDVLGREVLISTHLSAARANRKPVLQLLTARGETTGFAKVSVNPLTRELIQAERVALDALAAANLRTLTVPRVLHHGRWQGREVLVMDALPTWRRRRALRSGQLTAAMAELAGVPGLSRGPLTGSAFLARLTARLDTVPAGADRDALAAVLGALTTAGIPGAELGFGAWHGDWTGWNMASVAGELLVWDWERFTRSVPYGFDALHYRLQTAVVGRRQPPAAAAAACARSAPVTLAPFGVPPDEARLTGVLYLTELSVRYLADRQDEAGARLGRPGTWLIPAIAEAMRNL